MVPDILTYSALISACGKGMSPEQTREFFEAMQRQDVAPNVITYSALITACRNTKQSEHASEVFEAM